MAAATALAVSPMAPSAALAAEPSEAAVVRVAGTNRIDTAVQVARTGWTSASRALLATSEDYPDAVAAAAYAAVLDAPLLLTKPDVVAQSVVDVLEDLRVQRVTILGGPRAVSTAVEDQLRALGLEVDRQHGSNRYGTAVELAQQVARRGRVEVVALALGDRADGRDAWPDALAAASLAALDRPVPTLLSRRTFLPEDTVNGLQVLAPGKVILLGGEGALTPDVERQLDQLGIPWERLDGSNRYETAVLVAETAMTGETGVHGELAPEHAVVVSGLGFADALGAGALATKLSAPLLLVPGGQLADEVDAFVRSDATSLTQAIVVGGPKVVAEFVEQELEAALAGQPRPEPPPACDLAYSSPDCKYTYRHTVETWERLADCESHGNWQTNTGNGYYGGLQFHINTWRSVGGTGYPHEHSKWEQIHRGDILQERAGWGQWPHCSRKLGYR